LTAGVFWLLMLSALKSWLPPGRQ